MMIDLWDWIEFFDLVFSKFDVFKKESVPMICFGLQYVSKEP